MAGIKGLKRDQSQYETHNWCTKCENWIEGKPHRCPECNKIARSHVRYKHGKINYNVKLQHRY